MYYITNQNNQVVAVDKTLLDLIGLQSVEELYQKVIKGELSLTSLSPEDLTIVFGENEEYQYTFDLKSTSLSSMLGELTLNVLTTSESAEEAEENISLSDEMSLIENEEEPISVVETEDKGADEEIISILDELTF